VPSPLAIRALFPDNNCLRLSSDSKNWRRRVRMRLILHHDCSRRGDFLDDVAEEQEAAQACTSPIRSMNAWLVRPPSKRVSLHDLIDVSVDPALEKYSPHDIISESFLKHASAFEIIASNPHGIARA
jgi:hypothetical protein